MNAEGVDHLQLRVYARSAAILANSEGEIATLKGLSTGTSSR